MKKYLLMLVFVSALATRQSPIFASENKVSAFIGARLRGQQLRRLFRLSLIRHRYFFQ